VNVPVALGRVRACAQHGRYLLRDGEAPLAALLRGPSEHGGMPRIQIEAMARDPEAAAGFLAEIREGMLRHNVYSGQLLALGNPHGPFGEGRAMVEFLAMPEIERNEVILPGGVLERVERHTVRFTEHARTLLAAWTRPPRYLYPTPNAGGV
jgi:hypothetical protein